MSRLITGIHFQCLQTLKEGVHNGPPIATPFMPRSTTLVSISSRPVPSRNNTRPDQVPQRVADGVRQWRRKFDTRASVAFSQVCARSTEALPNPPP